MFEKLKHRFQKDYGHLLRRLFVLVLIKYHVSVEINLSHNKYNVLINDYLINVSINLLSYSLY